MDSEKRKYPRYLIEDCTALIVDGTEIRVAELVDLSCNGALFSFKRNSKVSKGDIIKFFFFDRNAGTLCMSEATVVRVFNKEGCIHAGITFDDTLSVNKVINKRVEDELNEALATVNI